MGGAYGTRGGDGRCIEFRLEILKGRHHLEDLDKDRRVILDIRDMGFEGVDWIHLADDTDLWRLL
jgi:hypothetical protein